MNEGIKTKIKIFFSGNQNTGDKFKSIAEIYSQVPWDKNVSSNIGLIPKALPQGSSMGCLY